VIPKKRKTENPLDLVKEKETEDPLDLEKEKETEDPLDIVKGAYWATVMALSFPSH
jgi:hypothetical protein